MLMACSLWLGASSLASETVEIRAPGAYQLVGQTHDKKPLSISLQVSPGDSTKYSGYLGTQEGVSPRWVLTKITIAVSKETIFVPLAAYADISNMLTVSLLSTSGRTQVVIVGGDGAEGYKVVLTIAKENVSSRYVYPLGIRTPTQRSTYSLVNMYEK